MKRFQSLVYYLVVVLVATLLFVIEYMALNSILQMYVQHLIIRLAIYLGLMVIINPILTYFIANLVQLNIEGYKKEEIYAVHPEES